MKAVVLTGHGDMSKLVYRTDVPTPKTLGQQPPHVLIKVAAAGLNNTDVNTRVGWYATTTTSTSRNTDSSCEDQESPWHTIDFPRIQGADVCGHVVAVGSGVESANSSTSLLGKRVLVDPWLRDWDHPSKNRPPGYLGSSADGGFAEYCVVDYRNVHPIDEHKTSLTNAELATFPCSYSTAEGMLERAAVTDDDIVLVTGASGGGRWSADATRQAPRRYGGGPGIACQTSRHYSHQLWPAPRRPFAEGTGQLASGAANGYWTRFCHGRGGCGGRRLLSDSVASTGAWWQVHHIGCHCGSCRVTRFADLVLE